MSDEENTSDGATPILVTAALAAPILAVCCLGPVFYASIWAWVAGTLGLGGVDPVVAAGLAAIAVILAWAFVRRRKTRKNHDRGKATPGAPAVEQSELSSR